MCDETEEDPRELEPGEAPPTEPGDEQEIWT
jgi:hypothetical protein